MERLKSNHSSNIFIVYLGPLSYHYSKNREKLKIFLNECCEETCFKNTLPHSKIHFWMPERQIEEQYILLYPGYVFVQFNQECHYTEIAQWLKEFEEQHTPLKILRYSVHNNQEHYYALSFEDMQRIYNNLHSDDAIQLSEDKQVEIKDVVYITNGVFKGMIGEVMTFENAGRLLILKIKVFGYMYVKVKIEDVSLIGQEQQQSGNSYQ